MGSNKKLQQTVNHNISQLAELRVECNDDPVDKLRSVLKGKLILTMTLLSHLFVKEETKYSQGRFKYMPEQEKQV